MQSMHFDCVNGFLNSIKEIIWQTEVIYRYPLKNFLVIMESDRQALESKYTIDHKNKIYNKHKRTHYTHSC